MSCLETKCTFYYFLLIFKLYLIFFFIFSIYHCSSAIRWEDLCPFGRKIYLIILMHTKSPIIFRAGSYFPITYEILKFVRILIILIHSNVMINQALIFITNWKFRLHSDIKKATCKLLQKLYSCKNDSNKDSVCSSKF